MPAADAKGVRILKMFDSLAGPVTGDPARLQQVVWNLLSNAVKFTPRGGQIQVLLERVNSHVEITVIDTGIGIKPEFLPFVFDRFRQADASTTRRHGGLGLGLSIVKQLVEMHGGNVRAKSLGEEQGSTFTVSLPSWWSTIRRRAGAVRPQGPDRRARWTSPPPCWTASSVLVVDDEPDARELIKRVLAENHANVCRGRDPPPRPSASSTSTSSTSWSATSACPMPMGSTSSARSAREASVAKDLPAVALTAFARSEDRRRAMLAGFQVHVAKPVDPDELTAVVASLVGRTGQP